MSKVISVEDYTTGDFTQEDAEKIAEVLKASHQPWQDTTLIPLYRS